MGNQAMIPNEIADLVEIVNDQVVVSSVDVAKRFGKRHDHVIRDIENLIPQNWGVKYFEKTSYKNTRGKTYPMYLMNRDGFSLLAMGFTGKEAIEWKIKYINAFNWMEKQLKEENYLDKMPDDELMARALLIADGRIKELKALNEKQATKIKTDEPKVVFADAVMAADNDVNVRVIAKILCQNGVNIGQNRLFTWLTNHKYLIRTPYYYEVAQKSVNGGWLKLSMKSHMAPNNVEHITCQVKVTPKGQIYFVNKILKEHGFDPKEMEINYSVSDIRPKSSSSVNTNLN